MGDTLFVILHKTLAWRRGKVRASAHFTQKMCTYQAVSAHFFVSDQASAGAFPVKKLSNTSLSMVSLTNRYSAMPVSCCWWSLIMASALS